VLFNIEEENGEEGEIKINNIYIDYQIDNLKK